MWCGVPDTHVYSRFIGASLKIYVVKKLIAVVLVYPKISCGDLKGRVIVYAHKQSGLYAFLPGVISEGLSKGMVAYTAVQTGFLCGSFHYPECLYPGDGLVGSGGVAENIMLTAYRAVYAFVFAKIISKRRQSVAVDINTGMIVCLLLDNRDMFKENILLKIVNLFPGQAEDVRYPKCRVAAHDNEQVVA